MAMTAVLVGCYGDPPTVTGGEARFDAAPPPPKDELTIDRAGGSKWSELYRDYFGPTGAASCAGDGACHGSAGQAGARASEYVCPSTANGCYEGMVKGGLIPPRAGQGPEGSVLHVVLRKADGSGFMPKRPPKVFGEVDMARIDAWLAQGAPNDSTPLPGDAGLD